MGGTPHEEVGISTGVDQHGCSASVVRHHQVGIVKNYMLSGQSAMAAKTDGAFDIIIVPRPTRMQAYVALVYSSRLCALVLCVFQTKFRSAHGLGSWSQG